MIENVVILDLVLGYMIVKRTLYGWRIMITMNGVFAW